MNEKNARKIVGEIRLRHNEYEKLDDYEIRKNLKKSYLKHKYGKKFLSFNIEDLRNPDLIKQKLVQSGYM